MKILAVTIGGLGDAVLFSPVFKAMRSRYPQARIQLLVASRLAASAYGAASEIDRIFCLETNNRRSVRLVLALLKFCVRSGWRNGGYDLGVYATGLNPRLPAVLRLCAGVRQTIHSPKPPEHLTDLQCNVALARQFDPGSSTADAFVPISEDAEAEARQILQAAGIHPDDGLLAVYPSTELAHRPRWALPNFMEVIQRIRKHHFQGKIIVVGNRAEGREWAEAGGEGLVDANLSGRLSISGSAAVLKRCSLTIGGDGGLMHIAGAVGSPAVVVMVNAPFSYRPAGKQTSVVRSRLDCCDATYPERPAWCSDAVCRQSISIEDVYQACETTLRQTPAVERTRCG